MLDSCSLVTPAQKTWMRSISSSEAKFVEDPRSGTYEARVEAELVVLDDQDCDRLYEAAWREPTARSLDVSGSDLLAGAATTAAALEALGELFNSISTQHAKSGFVDAAFLFDGNHLDVIGYEDHLRSIWSDDRGSGHQPPSPPATDLVAQRLVANTDWGFSSLSLRDNCLGAHSQAGVVSISRALATRFAMSPEKMGATLLSLDLSDNPLMGYRCHRLRGLSMLVDAFVGAPRGTLKRLRVSRCALHQQACNFLAVILESTGGAALELLDVSDNPLGRTVYDDTQQEALQNLARVVRYHLRLASLDVRNCEVTDASGTHFADAAAEAPALRRLRLSRNPRVGLPTARRLGAAIAASECLEELDVASCDLSADALKAIAVALPNARSLRILDLSDNPVGFTTRGNPAYPDGLRGYPGDERFELDYWNLDETLHALIAAARRTTALRQVRLGNILAVDPDPYALAALSRVLKANHILPTLLDTRKAFKWDLADAGVAKVELLRKLHHLPGEDLRRLRSNVSFMSDDTAKAVIDALVPPTKKSIAMKSVGAFEKVNRGDNPFRRMRARTIQRAFRKFRAVHRLELEAQARADAERRAKADDDRQCRQRHRDRKARKRAAEAKLQTTSAVDASDFL